MLGSSSLNRICRVGTPITRAAWTNSRSRSDSTSPRIRRASVIQPVRVRMHEQRDDLGVLQQVRLVVEPQDDDRGHGQRHQQERQRQEDVDHEGDDPVEPAAAEAGDQADA